MTALLPVVAFLVGLLGVTVLAFLLRPAKAAVIDRRLQEVTGSHQGAGTAPASARPAVQFLKRIGEKVPRSPKELGTLRLRLVRPRRRKSQAHRR